MISTQAMPGVTVVFLYLAVVWFVLYAACGALPCLAAGAEKRMVAAAFWGFGIGGAAAGELVAILVMSDNLALHARVLGAFAIPATIHWLLGFFMTRWLAAGWGVDLRQDHMNWTARDRLVLVAFLSNPLAAVSC